MKRGILSLGLFLVVLLVISGCGKVQQSPWARDSCGDSDGGDNPKRSSCIKAEPNMVDINVDLNGDGVIDVLDSIAFIAGDNCDRCIYPTAETSDDFTYLRELYCENNQVLASIHPCDCQVDPTGEAYCL